MSVDSGPIASRRLYLRGLILSGLGMLLLSPDALAMRLMTDAGPWTVVFYRALCIGISVFLALQLVRRRSMKGMVVALGPAGLGAAVALAVSNASFVGAVANTTVANTLIILAMTPFFSALLGRLLIGEAVEGRTWAGIGVAFLGVLVTVSGSFGGGAWQGDLSALSGAASQALALVLLRRKSLDDIFAAFGLSGFVGALMVLPLAWPPVAWGADLMILAAAGLLMIPLGYGLFLSGVATVPAAEVALLALVETVLGPVLVWIGLGEVPGVHTAVGGAIVLGAIVANAGLALRERQPTPGPGGG